MGGQDCKAIRCDENGKVTSFLMNDKCAAGTGRGMEVFADLFNDLTGWLTIGILTAVIVMMGVFFSRFFGSISKED